MLTNYPGKFCLAREWEGNGSRDFSFSARDTQKADFRDWDLRFATADGWDNRTERRIFRNSERGDSFGGVARIQNAGPRSWIYPGSAGHLFSCAA